MGTVKDLVQHIDKPLTTASGQIVLEMRFLLNLNNKRVVPWSDILGRLDYMVPCDRHGNTEDMQGNSIEHATNDPYLQLSTNLGDAQKAAAWIEREYPDQGEGLFDRICNNIHDRLFVRSNPDTQQLGFDKRIVVYLTDESGNQQVDSLSTIHARIDAAVEALDQDKTAEIVALRRHVMDRIDNIPRREFC